MANLPLPRQDVVRLGMVPSPHPFLLPRPSFLSRLHLAPPEGKFSRSVDKIYFVYQVDYLLLPSVPGVLNMDIKIAQD